MNVFIACSTLLFFFYNSHAMDIIPQLSPEQKKEIAQRFFAIALTKPAHHLLNTLSCNAYYELMNIAEQRKEQLFYAELTQTILPHELCNRLAHQCLNPKTILKAAVSKHCVEKILLKQVPDYQKYSFHIAYSNNGNYFIENISNGDSDDKIYLWNMRKNSIIKTIPGSLAFFSPANDYLIVYSTEKTNWSTSFLYSIKKDTFTELPISSSCYNPDISPDGRYIMQYFQENNIKKHKLCCVNNDYTIQAIPLEDSWAHITSIVFHPDNKHLICSDEKNIMICDNNNPRNKSILARTNQCILQINQNGSLLLALQGKKTQLLNIKNLNKATLIKKMPLLEGKATFLSKKIILEECYSTISLYKTSNNTKKIQSTEISHDSYIRSVSTTQKELFLIQGYKTKLRDTKGNKIFSCDKSKNSAINMQASSIITIEHFDAYIRGGDWPGRVFGPTKIWLWNLHPKTVKKTLCEINNSLTLPQALMLNQQHKQRRQKECMHVHQKTPEERTRASFKQDHTFLIKGFIAGNKS